ncbi:MAG: ABC transporter permease [Thaumarchaeota archaeon]|nr:ABC transporter permease [Candidatus Geocrenenecus arthurdayi]
MRKFRRLRSLMIGAPLLVIVLYVLGFFGIEPIHLLETSFMAMTPLILAAIGETLNERSGIVNIGLEGIFLITSVTGVYLAELTGNGIGGIVLGGALIGALIGFFFGLISTYGRAAQVIAGMGLNLIGLGLVPFLMMAFWAFPGIHIFDPDLRIKTIDIIIGDHVFRLSPITLFAVICVIFIDVLLYRTLLGIRIQAAGEKPEALDVAGFNVNLTRLLVSTICGGLTGIGGAFMPLGWFGGLVKEITAGRGFIALAATVFSGLDPILAATSSFIFGFSEGLAFTFMITPGVKEAIPYYFVNMIPYIVTILALAFIGSKRFPKALGKPYIRE